MRDSKLSEAFKPGWLNRQFANAKKDVEELPAWLRQKKVEDFCPNCGESKEISKIKGCIRCLKCHWKEDCHGW